MVGALDTASRVYIKQPDFFHLGVIMIQDGCKAEFIVGRFE